MTSTLDNSDGRTTECEGSREGCRGTVRQVPEGASAIFSLPHSAGGRVQWQCLHTFVEDLGGVSQALETLNINKNEKGLIKRKVYAQVVKKINIFS